MASTMVVPPSKHALFMRGFSTRQDIQKIREFFSHDAGGCTVEFFKESDDRNKLFLALRFESREAAKEILHKYDNTEVLGDRITISWFKDLRRARQKAAEEQRRQQGRSSPLRNGFRPGQYSRGQGPGDRRGGQGGSWGRRQRSSSGGAKGRRTDHSSSPSHSRSRSRSRSPSDSRSGSSHSRSHSRSRSHSHSPTPHKDKDSVDRQTSPDGRGAGDPGSSRWDASPDYPSGRMEQRSQSRGSSADKWSKEVSPKRSVSHDREWNDDKEHGGIPRDWSRREWAEERERERDWSVDGGGDNTQQLSSANKDWDRDRSSSSATMRASATVWDPELDPSPRGRLIRSTVAVAAVPSRQESYAPDQSPSSQQQRSSRPTRQYFEREEDFSRQPRRESSVEGWRDDPPKPPSQKTERWNEKDSQYSSESARKRSVDLREEYIRPSKDVDMREIDNKRRKFIDEGGDLYPQVRPDDSACSKPNLVQSVKRMGHNEPGHFQDDNGTTGAASVNMTSTMLASVNGSVQKEMERGVFGLSQDKMILVRDKKEEIEKAYRQDCETFAAVVKMLISKDSELESRMQGSLRENLKDIGQRCIHELREFIEKLKSQEGPKSS